MCPKFRLLTCIKFPSTYFESTPCAICLHCHVPLFCLLSPPHLITDLLPNVCTYCEFSLQLSCLVLLSHLIVVLFIVSCIIEPLHFLVQCFMSRCLHVLPLMIRNISKMTLPSCDLTYDVDYTRFYHSLSLHWLIFFSGLWVIFILHFIMKPVAL